MSDDTESDESITTPVKKSGVSSTKKKGGKGLIIAIVIIIIVLVLVGLGIGLYFIFRPKKKLSSGSEATKAFATNYHFQSRFYLGDRPPSEYANTFFIYFDNVLDGRRDHDVITLNNGGGFLYIVKGPCVLNLSGWTYKETAVVCTEPTGTNSIIIKYSDGKLYTENNKVIEELTYYLFGRKYTMRVMPGYFAPECH